METLQTLTRRINTTGKLKSIVKSMKTLSAVNIRQYEKAVAALESFEQTIFMGLQVCLTDYSLPLSSGRSAPGDRLLVAFGSDQGLCGQFNEKLARFIGSTTGQRQAKTHTIVVGARLYARLESMGIAPCALFWTPGSVGGINHTVFQILLKMEALQAENRISQVDFCYSRHEPGTAETPVCQALIPLDHGELAKIARQPWDGPSLAEFSIPAEQLFSNLIRQYFFVALFRAQAHAMASEQASRLRSLQNAEKNIEEHQAGLQALFRSKRQATITAEMLDLVTGFKTIRRKKQAESE